MKKIVILFLFSLYGGLTLLWGYMYGKDPKKYKAHGNLLFFIDSIILITLGIHGIISDEFHFKGGIIVKGVEALLWNLILICAGGIPLAVIFSDTEKVYTVVRIYPRYDDGGNILLQAQSGNTYEVSYSSKIGVDIGDKVVILFESGDNSQRIKNAETGVSSVITEFSPK